MKIGIFDSGIGGLSVLQMLIKIMPNEEYFYYLDSVHVPYGEKSKEDIIKYTDEAIAFLINEGCDITCIACNTATSVAAEILRKKYSTPIVGVEPAVKPAVELSANGEKEGRILVIATPVTVSEKKLHDLIEKFDNEHLVDMKALPKLPSYAEKGMFEGEEVMNYLYDEFKDTDCSIYSEIVLGCTHFKHFTKALREIFGENIEFLDGALGTARNIKRIADNNNFVSEGSFKITYYESGKMIRNAERIRFLDSVLKRLEIID